MKTRRWNKNTQFYTAVGLADILVTVALLGPLARAPLGL